MFDIGFSELFIIMLVGLIVIGPERLPKVARTIGAMLGRLQRYVNDVKADINREVELEELRKMKAEFEQAARSVEQSVGDELHRTEADLNRSIAPPVSTPENVLENPPGQPLESAAQQAAVTHPDSGAPDAPARAATGTEETRAKS
jgi:sec-independent protein translocase protein TatB